MAPKKRRQHVGALNYQKRRDIAGGARSDDGGLECAAESIEGEPQQSGEVVVMGTEESGEPRVEGGSGGGELSRMGSGELRVEGGTETRDEGDPESSNYCNEDELVARRPRLSEISAMADEPI